MSRSERFLAAVVLTLVAVSVAWGDSKPGLRIGPPLKKPATSPEATPVSPSLKPPAPKTPEQALPVSVAPSRSRPEDHAGLSPGRHLFIAVSGSSLTPAEAQLLRDIKPGGVVLLGANVKSRAQTEALVTSIKEAADSGKQLFDFPLIAVDQEGGSINRLGLADSPSARALGAAGNTESARRVGQRYAEECRARGIGIVLAPVLDVFETGSDSVIGSRSFGSEPDAVSAMGLSFADGLRIGGVVPVVKHFPGHGSSRSDSHRTLATLNKEGQALDAVLRPFRDAVELGLPAIMTGHIACPSLSPGNPGRPASLSRDMLRAFLRGEEGYTGVLLTDDLNMGAIMESFSLEEATVAALAAGNDAVIICDPSPKRIRAVCGGIEQAVLKGQLDPRELKASQARLNKMAKALKVQSQIASYRGISTAAPTAAPAETSAAVELPPPPKVTSKKADASATVPGPTQPPIVSKETLPVAKAKEGIRKHTVVWGETSHRIGKLYGVTKDELKLLNPEVKDLSRLKEGQVLKVPAKKKTSR